MDLEIRTMTEAEAEEIIGWSYPGEYSFYDIARDIEHQAELRAAHVREHKYFSALRDDELIGYFEFESEDDILEVGLGLRPDLTGAGLGGAFFDAGLAFARARFQPKTFRLRVATFNERAIKVYERAGFERGRTYTHDFYGTPYEFMEMTRPD